MATYRHSAATQAGSENETEGIAVESSLVLNRNMLSESTGGDDEFAQELFGDLIPRAHSLRETIAQAVEQNSADAIRKAAHELKGSCLTLGAERLANVSKDLENLGRTGSVAGAAELLIKLDTELDALVVHLTAEGLFAAV